MKKEVKKPTEAELAILGFLWQNGASTVREVHDAINEKRGAGYTTTLKLMQIMLEKGLVNRDDSGHAHIFRAAKSRKQTQKGLINNLVKQAFDGSAQQLILQALSSKKSTREELAEIRELINQLEEKQA